MAATLAKLLIEKGLIAAREFMTNLLAKKSNYQALLRRAGGGTMLSKKVCFGVWNSDSFSYARSLWSKDIQPAPEFGGFFNIATHEEQKNSQNNRVQR